MIQRFIRWGNIWNSVVGFNYQQISGGKLELEGNGKVEASVLREWENYEPEPLDPCQCTGLAILQGTLSFVFSHQKSRNCPRRTSCLRWGRFTRLLTRSITKLTTWSPGLRAPVRLRAGALQECVGEWGESLQGESPPPPSASCTSCTPSSSPRSRSCVSSTTATLPTSGAWASCTSASRCPPPWCGTGSSRTWTMKRYVVTGEVVVLWGAGGHVEPQLAVVSTGVSPLGTHSSYGTSQTVSFSSHWSMSAHSSA